MTKKSKVVFEGGSSSVSGVAAVDRAFSLLMAFSEKDTSLSLNDLALRTGFYKSTILRLTKSLLHFSFLERDIHGQFRIGPNAWRVGTLFTQAVEIQDRLMPLVRKLSSETEESVSVYVPVLSPAPPSRVCILRINSAHWVRDHVELGDSLTLDHGAGGRMIRAYVAPQAEDEEIKKSGYVLSFDARRPGIGGLAAPIFGPDKQLLGSLTISAPTVRRKRAWFVTQIPAIVAVAAEATTLSGGSRRAGSFPYEQISVSEDQLRKRREFHAGGRPMKRVKGIIEANPIFVRKIAAALMLGTLTFFPLMDARAQAPAELTNAAALTVCLDPSYPPMEFFKASGDAEPVGFDVDLATELAKEWGLTLRLVKIDFAGLLPAVQAGRCDLLISGATVQEKRTKVLPAVAYFKTGRAILVGKDKAAEIKSPADLSGRTVAIQAGTSFVDVAKTFDEDLKKSGKAGLNIQPYPKATEVFEQLRNGRADAVITNETEIAYRSSLTPGDFVTAYTMPQKEVFGIYYRPQPQMKVALESALAKLRRNNFIQGNAKKWGLPEANADVAP